MKLAYPQGFKTFVATPYNTKKWADTLTTISQLKSLHPEFGFDEILDYITKDWDVVEKNDFKHWVRYYQENNQNKYKTAQFNMNIFKAVQPPSPVQTETIEDVLKQDLPPSQLNDEEIIEKKIKSFISRMNSAEKIFTEPKMRDYLLERLGPIEYAKAVEQIHITKRKIQTAPLKNIKSTLLEDLIYRSGSSLIKDGFNKSGNLMKAIAQLKEPEDKSNEKSLPGVAKPEVVKPKTSIPPLKPAPAKPTILPSAPQAPIKPGGSPMPMAPIKDDSAGEDAIRNLIKGMNMDDQDVNDVVDIYDDPISDMHIIAQEIPLPPPTPTEPTSIDEVTLPPEEDTTEDLIVDSPSPEDSLDGALQGVTMDNLVEELETAANILRNRELPRIYSKIDLYMDQLQVSSYFPQMGEAQAKALDANQYQLTRVEEVLSKVRGAIKNPMMKNTLENEQNKPLNPEIEGIKNSIENEESREKARKERRKQEEMNKASPPVPKPPVPPITNIEEDLSAKPVVLPPAPKPQGVL